MVLSAACSCFGSSIARNFASVGSDSKVWQKRSSTASLLIILLHSIMSSFGDVFRVVTYGESHCKSVGCIVDGCPPVGSLDFVRCRDIDRLQGMRLTEEDIQIQLSRRRPGQSDLTTAVCYHVRPCSIPLTPDL